VSKKYLSYFIVEKILSQFLFVFVTELKLLWAKQFCSHVSSCLKYRNTTTEILNSNS